MVTEDLFETVIAPLQNAAQPRRFVFLSPQSMSVPRVSRSLWRAMFKVTRTRRAALEVAQL
jgi:hypothetical protein